MNFEPYIVPAMITIIAFFLKKDFADNKATSRDTNKKVTKMDLDIQNRPTFKEVSESVKEKIETAGKDCEIMVEGKIKDHVIELHKWDGSDRRVG